MKYVIITGASKGLGESVARLFLQEKVRVIGISRTKNVDLENISQALGVEYTHYPCDLASLEALEDTCDKIKTHVFNKNTEKVYLINNAATVNPIDVSKRHSREAIERHVSLNITAPMFTTSRLLHDAEKFSTPVVVANISSGAADRSTYGWSLYGASKAAINRYTKTVALEVDELKEPHKVIIFDPSIMDTAMQQTIRQASEDQFKEVDTFIGFKDKDALRHPAVVGRVLVDLLLADERLVNGQYYRIHDYV